MPGQSSYARMGKLSSILFILPSSMGGGWLVGYYLVDSWLGSFPWGSIFGTALGAGAGFYEIIRLLLRDASGHVER